MIMSCLKVRSANTEVVDRIKTLYMFNIFFFENYDIYEVTWKNLAHPDRPQVTM